MFSDLDLSPFILEKEVSDSQLVDIPDEEETTKNEEQREAFVN